MTITEFLEARIAEDDAAARGAVDGAEDDGRWGVEDDYGLMVRVKGKGILIYDEGGHTEGQAAHIARWDPARVLAECAAKRAIIGLHAEFGRSSEPGASAAWSALGGALQDIAAVYSDHPDYDKDWAL